MWRGNDGAALKTGSHNGAEGNNNLPIHVDMRTFYIFLGDVLRRGPSDTFERATPWIIGILGAGMLGIMFYSWLAAWL